MDLLNNRMKKVFYILLLFTFFQVSGQKTYFKDYYDNGKLKSEGWVNQNKKSGLLVLLF
jgi:antitoxin component YwqK of YwqJK toxin-antitoxin module